MFGRTPRVRPPVLLILVFGVLLVLVGITATAQAIMVSAYASTSTLRSVLEGDVATVRGFVHEGLDGVSAADLAHPDAATSDRIGGYLQTLLAKGGIAHAEIRDAGRPCRRGQYAARPSGGRPPPIPRSVAALAGAPSVDVVDRPSADADVATLPPTVLREYLPLQQGRQTVLVSGCGATPADAHAARRAAARRRAS